MFGRKNNSHITEEKVLAALSHVDDPDLKKDIVTLGMVKDVKVKGKNVSFMVVLTTPACPMKDAIHKACVNAVKLMVDKEANVNVNMTAQVTRQKNNQTLPNIKNIIAISSGKGGVGKSTVAANLAVALANMGSTVALVDADIYGPSQPIMFGIEKERPYLDKINGKNMLVPFRKHGVRLMSLGNLVPAEKAIVWRGPMASKALRQIIFDTNWGDIDYMLIDLPPGTGDVHLTLVQALPVTGAVVVTTPQKVALADAKKGAQMFRSPQINVPILGVIENMAYFVPDDAPEKQYYIFGKGGGAKLAKALDTTLLGQIPMREGIAEDSDFGRPPALYRDNVVGIAFSEIAQRVAQQIAIRNAQQPASETVKITRR